MFTVRRVCLFLCGVWAVSNLGCGDDVSSANAVLDTDTTHRQDSATGTGMDEDDTSVQGTDEGWQDGTDSTVVVGEGGELLVDGDGKQFVCYETQCDGRLLECGDCKDNDSDGMTDWRDPECLGPCDNTEGPALISDVGGVTGSTCHVDCYFDYGNGMGTGSDDCWWSHECDPLEPEGAVCEYNETLIGNPQFCPDEQTQLCTDVCVPFTPNGCDCFGCCTFPELEGLGTDGDDAYVWIGAKDADNIGTCTFADILDESKCPRCTPVANCLNECGYCEICIGKPELPADCYGDGDDSDGTPDDQCPTGIEPCTVSDVSPCDAGFYCVSGCCQPVTVAE
ncbi:MAG: hypothetical protein JXX29_04785 [Deltaproteobacteria bacterium]|nr:hypothetical protein [Deltaproteobacteria bacterium]MBN2670962.1 hypothetical protein [Deltaproteobacteria bacterium]